FPTRQQPPPQVNGSSTLGKNKYQKNKKQDQQAKEKPRKEPKSKSKGLKRGNIRKHLGKCHRCRAHRILNRENLCKRCRRETKDILHLFKVCFPEHYESERKTWKRWINAKYLNTIYDGDGAVVYQKEYYKYDDHLLSTIYLLAVRPEKQRQGIGRRLLSLVESESDEVALECKKHNVPFYKKLGYTQWREPGVYHDDTQAKKYFFSKKKKNKNP
ncbi:MAG: GNAT family N-acetyltransferase, partial [Candidatus Helarchaeales archaeon]